jgi:hypothetical protein
MTAISELKMHLRDEDVRIGTKTRLKREFAARTTPIPVPSPPSEEFPAAVIDPTSPVSNLPEQDDEGSPGSASSCAQSFQSIITQQMRLAEEDDLDNEPIGEAGDIGGPWKITALFDFTRDYWVNIFSKSAQRSFQEELELYELLDLDEDGAGHTNVDVDDSTADALLS